MAVCLAGLAIHPIYWLGALCFYKCPRVGGCRRNRLVDGGVSLKVKDNVRGRRSRLEVLGDAGDAAWVLVRCPRSIPGLVDGQAGRRRRVQQSFCPARLVRRQPFGGGFADDVILETVCQTGCFWGLDRAGGFVPLR